jgi:hypothetical protein
MLRHSQASRLRLTEAQGSGPAVVVIYPGPEPGLNLGSGF